MLAVVAVPSAVAKWTVTACALAKGMLTVKTALVVPLSPSTLVTSSMLMVASSLRIVPRAPPTKISALLALERLTKKDSSGSGVVSPLTWTVTVLLVWPGLNVRSPLVAW